MGVGNTRSLNTAFYKHCIDRRDKWHSESMDTIILTTLAAS
uniref:Uncharacterized protein n=1 Tax=Anguilla anguilla TaxID=7936 RepID=A0A0E9V601_ANGAN